MILSCKQNTQPRRLTTPFTKSLLPSPLSPPRLSFLSCTLSSNLHHFLSCPLSPPISSSSYKSSSLPLSSISLSPFSTSLLSSWPSSLSPSPLPSYLSCPHSSILSPLLLLLLLLAPSPSPSPPPPPPLHSPLSSHLSSLSLSSPRLYLSVLVRSGAVQADCWRGLGQMRCDGAGGGGGAGWGLEWSPGS